MIISFESFGSKRLWPKKFLFKKKYDPKRFFVPKIVCPKRICVERCNAKQV